jgi:Tol biopolymer transport system component
VLRLEEPRSGAVYRVIGRTLAVLGADDRQVVFVPAACGPDCDLTLSDLANGSSRFLPEVPGNPVTVAFSRDGRRLAIGYAGRLPDDPDPSTQRDGYAVVMDLDPSAEHWEPVPNVTTGPASAPLPVWAPDGRLMLVVPTDGAGSGRVVAWKPGAARVTILPVGLTGFWGNAGLVAPVS